MKKISFLLIMILFSTSALSKDYYFITGINNNKIETGITVSTASLDEDDDDMFFTIGYNYSDNLGIDISFFETGDATLSGDNGDRFTLEGTEYEFIVNNAKISVSSENVAIGLRPKAKLSEELDVFGRIGYHFYEATASASGDGITTASLTDDDSSDFFYGFGLSYKVGNFYLNAGLEYYQLDYDYIDEIKTEFISIGFISEF
ncbi:porin family protein [Candidatus Pelagibacter sp.]|nr:porin family protein [Candidatus Pelagibacter sp.]